MGRITVQVSIENVLQPTNRLRTQAMVDTGATYLTLPESMSEQLGDFEKNEVIEIELADGRTHSARLCGPVKIQIDDFSAIYSEVLFLPTPGGEGRVEPLLGYIPLETSRLAVDMLSHRLVPLKYADVKQLGPLWNGGSGASL